MICEDVRDTAAVGAKGRKRCARISTASTLSSRVIRYQIEYMQLFDHVLAMKVITLTDHTSHSKVSVQQFLKCRKRLEIIPLRSEAEFPCADRGASTLREGEGGAEKSHL